VIRSLVLLISSMQQGRGTRRPCSTARVGTSTRNADWLSPSAVPALSLALNLIHRRSAAAPAASISSAPQRHFSAFRLHHSAPCRADDVLRRWHDAPRGAPAIRALLTLPIRSTGAADVGFEKRTSGIKVALDLLHQRMREGCRSTVNQKRARVADRHDRSFFIKWASRIFYRPIIGLSTLLETLPLCRGLSLRAIVWCRSVSRALHPADALLPQHRSGGFPRRCLRPNSARVFKCVDLVALVAPSLVPACSLHRFCDSFLRRI
jgi:hypothetical protein